MIASRCRFLNLLPLCAALVAGTATAQELLTAGDFEFVAGEVPSWELLEFRTGNPGDPVNSAALAPFADNPGGIPGASGLWLRAFVGNPIDGTAEAILSQTVPGTPGETYTFSGEARFEDNYAGGVATLDPLSPSGAIPSPTRNFFQLEFLDSSGAMIGSAIQADVANDVFNGFGYAPVTPVSGIAPTGTTSVRVSAIANELIQNIDPAQSAFYDNFSLTTSTSPSTELLANAGLNEAPGDALDFYDVVELPSGADTVQLAGFANDPATGGSEGVWIRGFVEGDTSISQAVAAIGGATYAFSASSRWETNYSGGLAGTGTETLLELAFLDADGAVTGNPTVLDLRTVQMNDNTWRRQTVSGMAPLDAVEVRVAGIVNGTVSSGQPSLSAFWDDFSLVVTQIPEPTAGMSLAIGGLILLMRRSA